MNIITLIRVDLVQVPFSCERSLNRALQPNKPNNSWRMRAEQVGGMQSITKQDQDLSQVYDQMFPGSHLQYCLWSHDDYILAKSLLFYYMMMLLLLIRSELTIIITLIRLRNDSNDQQCNPRIDLIVVITALGNYPNNGRVYSLIYFHKTNVHPSTKIFIIL